MKFNFFKNNKTAFFIAVASIFAVFSFAFISNAQVKHSKENEKPKKLIIIDAGHGGEDGGAVASDGTTEKDINLAISLKLRDFLKTCGNNVIMTREKDTAIYDKLAKTLREKKRSDIKNRLKIINENKDSGIFVSIHQNKFNDEKYFGAQIFYSVNDEKSKILAEEIKKSVTELLQPENQRETKPANNKIFLLKNAKIPAVIVECGFLSNPAETEKLKSEKYQNEIAFSIFCGITNYLINNP